MSAEINYIKQLPHLTKLMKTKQISHKLVISFVLIAVIFFAGCAGGKKGVFNFGKDSLNVGIDTEGRDTFDSLQPFTITVTAENTGLFDAEKVGSRLQGYDGITAQSQNVKLSDEKKLSPSTLDRPDSEKKTKGGIGTFDWDVYAPFVGEGEPDRFITLTAEVLYDTKSLATQRVVAATRDYINDAQARGESVPTMPETESLNGPISVDVEIPAPYIKLLGDQQTDFRAKITFNNDGTGTLLNRANDQTDYMTKVVLKIPAGVGVDAANCDLVPLGSTSDVTVERSLIVDLTHNPEKLRLLEGGLTRDLNCHLYVDKDYVSGYNTFNLKVESYYTYIQDIQHDLVIKGTEERPLRVTITDPTTGTPDYWTKGNVESVKFILLYQNVPITSGVTQNDIIVKVGDKEATKAGTNALTYDKTDKVWELKVKVPDLGNDPLAADLEVEAKYGADSTTALQRNAVNYCKFLANCP